MPPHTPTNSVPPPPSPRRNSKPAFIISSKPLSSLSDPKCPICWEPYTEIPPPGSKLPPAREFPVSVDMVATPYRLRRCCGHVMGRKCLERHLETRGEWRNKCPLCRDEWYTEPNREDLPRADVRGRSRSIHAGHRSERDAPRLSRGASEPRMGARHGVGRERRRRRTRRRMAEFIPRLFKTLNVSDENLEIEGSVEEVEMVLREMYRRLEE